MNDIRHYIIVALGVVALAFFFRSGNLHHELDRLKTEYATASAEADAEAARIGAAQARLDAETADGWAAAVDYWRTQPVADRVRVITPVCPGTVPAVSGAAGKPAQSYVEESRPGATVDAAECEARLNAAVVDAAWIEHVKEWVRKQANR